ncbi:MAG: amidase [Burkholderiaceae bacterium]
METTLLPAHELSHLLHTKALSCRELMAATLARIAQVNPQVNAIVSLRDADELLKQADRYDTLLANGQSMGWLHGIPQAIKDLSPTAGLRTTLGSPLLADFVPKEDGLMVQRMKAAGAIVIGKTNVPEFGLGSHTFNPVFGPSRNPYDLSKTPGGSSGGAAVALATGMLSVADGSDFMGSLRNPAAWCNIFGMRPSQGRVPMWPAADVWTAQLGTEGPMARDVQSLAMLLQTQSGFDQRAPLSIATNVLTTGTIAGFDSKNKRVAWLGDLNSYLATERGILDVCGQGLTRLEQIGCAVEPTALGFAPERVWEAWLVWRKALVASRIAPFLLQPANRDKIKPEALWEHDSAQSLTGAEFMQASATRSSFYQHLLSLFEKFDYLALPCTQVWPFAVQERWPQQIDTANGTRSMDTYHRWMESVIYATFAGLPCISIPCGFSEAGMPMGLQIIGKPQDDLGVLQLAYAYEQVAQAVLSVRPSPA